MANELLMIPFIVPSGTSRRQLELVSAEAKSHAAAFSHRRARSQKTLNERNDARKWSSGTDRAFSSKTIRSSRSSPNTTGRAQTVRHQQSESPTPIADAFRRSDSWSFGSLGGPGKLEGFDAVAVQFFNDWTLGASPAAAVALKCYLSETLQRAVEQPILLTCLVSSIAFEMANKRTNGGAIVVDTRLTSVARRYNANALQRLSINLSSSNIIIADNEDSQINVFSGIAHLCMGAIRARETLAAEAHLLYIDDLLNKFTGFKIYLYILQGSIIGTDLRASLEDGKFPTVVSLKHAQQLLQSTIGNGADAEELQMLGKRWAEHMADYRTCILRGRLDYYYLQNPHAGLWWALGCTDLLIPIIQDTLHVFCRNFSNIGKNLWPGSEPYLRSLGNIDTRVLYQLCLQYSQIVDLLGRTSSAGTLSIAEKIYTLDQTLRSQALLIALQIQWVSRHHILPLRQALPILARRLKSCLEKMSEGPPPDLERAHEVLRHQLSLWIFVTGMLAAEGEGPIELDWFRKQTVRTISSLQLQTTESILSMLTGFTSNSDEVGARFESLARGCLAPATP